MSEERVDRTALERSLAAACEGVVLPPEQGFFGPDSVAWRIFRERALVSYAPRAVMLQYAYPPFAAASASYAGGGSPGARFERAVATLLRMIFGDRERVLRDARRLHVLHDRLHGTTELGAPFHGNDRASLAWVLVTLLDASIRGYERHVGAIADEAELFEEVARFAQLFGLAREDVPGSRRALDAAIERALADTLVVGAERRRERAGRAVLRGWAAATLPASMRAALGSGLSEAQAHTIERAGSVLRAWLVPPRHRYVEAYAEARARTRT